MNQNFDILIVAYKLTYPEQGRASRSVVHIVLEKLNVYQLSTTQNIK